MEPVTGKKAKTSLFVKVKGRQFVLEGTDQVVKLKGTNFQTPQQPWRWFSEEWLPVEAEKAMAAAESLGMNVFRTSLKARNSEFDKVFPKYLDMAERHGLRVYGVLNFPAAFAKEGTPEDKANLDYIRQIMTLLKDDSRIFAWDLRNEPDHCGDVCWQWGIEPEKGIKRSRWLARMTKEIRKIDKNHPISCGMTFSYSWWTPSEAEELTNAVDFLDFHYYRRNYRESTLAEEIKRVTQRYNKPLLIGEIGFSTDPHYSTAGELEHNEELQVKKYKEYLSDIKRTEACGVLQWALTDYDLPPDTGETEYGVYRIDYSLKPAGKVFRDEYTVEKVW
jgi:hypothetical protein